jgi:hypothetical protein
LPFDARSCSCEQIRTNRLQNALPALGDAMREVNADIEEMRKEHDSLASHIFVSRRNFRRTNDTKSGKRHHFVSAAQLAAGVRSWVSWDSRRVGTADGCRR